MNKPDKIDYAKLLGFDAVSDEISGGLDFQNETIGAKLGAKVGNEVAEPGKRAKVDYAKLLGFDGVSDQISGCVDFQSETIGAKLGAKVGLETDQGDLRTLSAPRI